MFGASSRWMENMKFAEYGVLFVLPKNGSALTGRNCDQSMFVIGLLGDAPKAGNCCGKRWPLFVPSAAVMNGVSKIGGAGLK